MNSIEKYPPEIIWAQFIYVLGCLNQPNILYMGMLLGGGVLKSVVALEKCTIFHLLEAFTK